MSHQLSKFTFLSAARPRDPALTWVAPWTRMFLIDTS